MYGKRYGLRYGTEQNKLPPLVSDAKRKYRDAKSLYLENEEKQAERTAKKKGRTKGVLVVDESLGGSKILRKLN
jgi:hypothetical protein